jgi:hypothetical protein
MDCEDRRLNDGCDGEEVKQISEELPNDGRAIFVLAFHVKAVVLSNGSQLVVASDKQ